MGDGELEKGIQALVLFKIYLLSIIYMLIYSYLI